METIPRLFQCVLCHAQTKICSNCDRGQIYCGKFCALSERTKSMKLAGARYQATFTGKRHHAARQALYRRRIHQIVTHQGSPSTPPDASMDLLENKPEDSGNRQNQTVLICCFCENPVSDWCRNDFLRRRSRNPSRGSRAYPQAP